MNTWNNPETFQTIFLWMDKLLLSYKKSFNIFVEYIGEQKKYKNYINWNLFIKLI